MGRGGVTIETAEPVPAVVISELGGMPGVKIRNKVEKVMTLTVSQDMDLVSFLSSRGIRIEQIKKQEASLEEIYTTIVKEAEQR
jgi:predicted regulator of amino acid metabolism with ACT domain